MLVFDDDLSLRNKIHCNYLISLGEAGNGALNKSHYVPEALKKAVEETLKLDGNHQAATLLYRLVDFDHISEKKEL
jgi:hypothetical protein